MLLLAIGSRGDVQPLAVLAGALSGAGVDARVVALREYADVVTQYGGGFVPVDADLADAIDSTKGPLGRLATGSVAGQGILLHRWCRRVAAPLADAVLGALRPGESIVTGILSRDVATALSDTHPVASVVFSGLLPTEQRESHYFYNHFTRIGPYNRWGARFSWVSASNVGMALGHEVRRRLDLPRLSPAAATGAADAHPIVVAASPTLVPSAPDWPATAHQTGFLAAPVPDFDPDDLLAEWLADGAAYVGFGSMTGGGGVDALPLLAAGARIADRRIITPATPGTPPGAISERVLAVGPTPHPWLFPRCSAVVHHGGSGTTHDGLRAGVPSVAVPHAVDQPYHGWRMHRLGVGPAPIPVRKLTPARLAAVLRDLTTDPAYRRRAAEVAARIDAEDGVARTALHLLKLGFS